MGFRKSDTINAKDNAELKAQVAQALRDDECSILALAARSGVSYGRIAEWVQEKDSRLSIVDYGKLWCVLNPEED